jgi:hypothetical protein
LGWADGLTTKAAGGRGTYVCDAMLAQLKTECGYQFTSKLESMFTDMKTSHDTMQMFKAAQAQAAGAGAAGGGHGVDMHVQVLTTGAWPTQVGATCNLPQELEQCCEEFKVRWMSPLSLPFVGVTGVANYTSSLVMSATGGNRNRLSDGG